MKRIAILSTDTPHHRYFINRLVKDGIPIACCILEKENIQPPFATGPLFEQEEGLFEKEYFFKDVPYDLDSLNVIPVTQINSPVSLDTLKSLSLDLGLVFGTRKLAPTILHTFSDGLMNVHRGISQDYRGLDSDLWAIYHDDYRHLGVTIHRIEESLDTGEIISQEHLKIIPEMKIYQIRYFTTLIATELAMKALHAYLDNRLSSYPQPQIGRYYSFMPLELKKIVMKKFNRHCELIHAPSPT